MAIDLNTLALPDLFATLTADGALNTLLALAHDEDLGNPPRDVTSETLLPADALGAGALVARAGGVIAGLAVMPDVIATFAPRCEWRSIAQDGHIVAPNQTIARVSGPLRELLALERTMLNIISHLSGVATMTRVLVTIAQEAAPAKPPSICDTRKTTPGWRALEKYAVRCGGGWLHRIGLHDAILIKDNHLRALGAGAIMQLAEPLQHARVTKDLRFVELEVDSLAQLAEALALPTGVIDIILLDNMSPEELAAAVAMRNDQAPQVQLEASGGVSARTLPDIARAGVDRVSVGALTHSVTALDIGFDFD